ncbi:heavy metal translocating P-type ATPase [Lachnobacterium bovis]|uniref:heavy metal translocating P-type ATPase n=1 Tax=Lachnobacterium bovis TaxID=140626 RepID=UPI0005597411|nr:heavy metal translocating P-type ATPase [Lachnobacterium bovis]
MKYVIRHESVNRIRIHCAITRMSMSTADVIEYYLADKEFVVSVKVYERTGDATIRYKSGKRQELLQCLEELDVEDEKVTALVPENTGRELNRYYQERLMSMVGYRVLKKLFMPAPIRVAVTCLRSIKYIFQGLSTLLHGKIEVPLLDAVAISVSILRGDYNTASSVMFLLGAGELLEEWTHQKSVNDLAKSMALKVDKVWLHTELNDVLVDIRDIQKGDKIVMRTSSIIPLDGKVVAGEVQVNQSSMTGESLPVSKEVGDFVYAGTVVEDGECVVEVTKTSGTGKYDQIIHMIEDSEKLKSGTEEKAFHLADRLVPYSLIGTGLTWLLTRNVSKAISFLMVDFSCALKLSMPLTVLSAIREAGEYNITAKGGKYLEAIAKADTIVFDKTGTLTKATPTFAQITTFNGIDETEALRIAACLEEHYPHSMANAVVKEAEDRGIMHEEMHSKVKYIIAHGIESEVDGKSAIIGSYHYIFEDAGCELSEEEARIIKNLPQEYSHLFMAIDGKLKAVIDIYDPIRKESKDIIQKLHEMGFTSVCMLTGDNKKTAKSVVSKLNIDHYHAEVLPEDKAMYIRKLKEQGHTVVMVGDGVNDTPALSEADCGIAVSDGAAIAREVADVIIGDDNLYRLLTIRQISQSMMERIRHNYHFIVGFNSLLIGLGVAGVLTPSASALFHNTSTVYAGIHSMRDLLPEKEEENDEMA